MNTGKITQGKTLHKHRDSDKDWPETQSLYRHDEVMTKQDTGEWDKTGETHEAIN